MSTPYEPPPPDWYLQQDKGPSILSAIVTVTVIGTIFTVTRLYVRQFIRGKLMVDDYLILVSMVGKHSPSASPPTHNRYSGR